MAPNEVRRLAQDALHLFTEMEGGALDSPSIRMEEVKFEEHLDDLEKDSSKDEDSEESQHGNRQAEHFLISKRELKRR